MLKGQCISSYRSKNTGKKTFVFKVTGTKEELEEYLDIQTKRFPEGKWQDSDGVYYWSTSPTGKSINLTITTNGNVVEDTTELDLRASANARYDDTYENIRKSLQFGGVSVTRADRDADKDDEKDEDEKEKTDLDKN